MTYTIIGPHHEETTLALLRARYIDCGPRVLFWASAGDADAAAAGDGYGNCVAQGDRR